MSIYIYPGLMESVKISKLIIYTTAKKIKKLSYIDIAGVSIRRLMVSG